MELNLGVFAATYVKPFKKTVVKTFNSTSWTQVLLRTMIILVEYPYNVTIVTDMCKNDASMNDQ